MFKVKAKKKFSQNFLTDSKIQEKVVKNWLDLFDRYSNLDYFLEIGPGTGLLTEQLLKKTKQEVLGIELDEDLVDLLEKKLGQYSNFKVLQKDGLSLNYQDLGNFLLVSNLPYQVGSRLLIEFSILRPDLPFSVILQKEVAMKTTFKENFTLFAFWLNLFYDLKILFHIPRESFKPKPNVTSSLIESTPKKDSLLKKLATVKERKEAFAILKKLFSQPRKSLANNLKNIGWDKIKIENFLKQKNYLQNFRWDRDNYKQVFLNILEQNEQD